MGVQDINLVLTMIMFPILVLVPVTGAQSLEYEVESRSFKDEAFDFDYCAISKTLEVEKESLDQTLDLIQAADFLSSPDTLALPKNLAYFDWLRDVSVIRLEGSVITIGHKCRSMDGFLPDPTTKIEFTALGSLMKMVSPHIVVQALELTFEGKSFLILLSYLI